MKHLFTICLLVFSITAIGCSDDEPSKSNNTNNKTDTGILQDTSQADIDETKTDIEEPIDTEEQTDVEEQTDIEEQTDTEEQTDIEEQTDTEEPTESICPPNHHTVDSAQKCTDAGNVADRERGCLTIDETPPTVFCAADEVVNCTRATIDACPEGYTSSDKETCESSDKPCGFYLLCDFMAWCLKN